MTSVLLVTAEVIAYIGSVQIVFENLESVDINMINFEGRAHLWKIKHDEYITGSVANV